MTESQDPPNQFGLQLFDPELKLVATATGPFAEGAKIEVRLGYIGNLRSWWPWPVRWRSRGGGASRAAMATATRTLNVFMTRLPFGSRNVARLHGD